MKIYKEKQMFGLSLLLISAMILFLMAMGIGEAQARYEAKISHDLTFEYQGDIGEIYLLSSEKDENGNYITDENGYMWNTGEWELVEGDISEDVSSESADESTESSASVEDSIESIIDTSENRYVLNFLVSNGRAEKDHCKVDQNASLALFTTVGVQQSENLKIVLTDGAYTYIAVPTLIEEGMMWYETYGPGWIYRFYNTSGEELSWPLPGDIFALRELTLTVTGQGEKVAALRLVAFAQMGLL